MKLELCQLSLYQWGEIAAIFFRSGKLRRKIEIMDLFTQNE